MISMKHVALFFNPHFKNQQFMQKIPKQQALTFHLNSAYPKTYDYHRLPRNTNNLNKTVKIAEKK